jgi:hypothetical protein
MAIQLYSMKMPMLGSIAIIQGSTAIVQVNIAIS